MAPKRKKKDSIEHDKEPIDSRPKRPVGRPPLKLPAPIPDTPENIARVIMTTKPKKRGEWRFEQERRKKSD